jgi:ectoine hydroxylase-related dioxygenase (phytanoyl-CoA dioxygenase family)
MNAENTCHHLIGLGASFFDYLKLFEDLNPYIEEYFGGKYILNSFGGNLLSKGASYANDIHRDIRSFSGDLPLMLNTIVMLDDFTEDNGATWLMQGGHIWDTLPSEGLFESQAFQITGAAGSVVVFNSNMWHRAGENKTDYPRRSVTPLFSRPFIKQGYDYCRALGDVRIYSPWLQQLLGYYSRTPQTLTDWYQPPEKRFYRNDQG